MYDEHLDRCVLSHTHLLYPKGLVGVIIGMCMHICVWGPRSPVEATSLCVISWESVHLGF